MVNVSISFLLETMALLNQYQKSLDRSTLPTFRRHILEEDLRRKQFNKVFAFFAQHARPRVPSFIEANKVALLTSWLQRLLLTKYWYQKTIVPVLVISYIHRRLLKVKTYLEDKELENEHSWEDFNQTNPERYKLRYEICLSYTLTAKCCPNHPLRKKIDSIGLLNREQSLDDELDMEELLIDIYGKR